MQHLRYDEMDDSVHTALTMGWGSTTVRFLILYTIYCRMIFVIYCKRTKVVTIGHYISKAFILYCKYDSAIIASVIEIVDMIH